MKIGCLLLWATIAPALLRPQSVYHPAIPKTWDEAALADWATPVAGLNVRPTHISAKEYYSVAEYNFRSYPVPDARHRYRRLRSTPCSCSPLVAAKLVAKAPSKRRRHLSFGRATIPPTLAKTLIEAMAALFKPEKFPPYPGYCFWANPCIDDAANEMGIVYENEFLRAQRARAGRTVIEAEFSCEAVGAATETQLRLIRRRANGSGACNVRTFAAEQS